MTRKINLGLYVVFLLLTSLSTANGQGEPIQSRIRDLNWDPSGSFIATANLNGEINIWNAKTGALASTLLQPSPYPSLTVEYSPDGSKLAGAGADQKVYIWDVNSGLLISTLIGHTAAIIDLAWSPNSTYLATVTYAPSEFFIWDINQEQVHQRMQPSAELYSVAWNNSGGMLTTASVAGIQIWHVNEVLPTQTFGNLDNQLDAQWLSGSSQIAASYGNLVQIWDVGSQNLLTSLQGHSGYVWSVVWSHNSQILASSDSDGYIYMWDISQETIITSFPTGTTGAYDIEFSPNGLYLAYPAGNTHLEIVEVNDLLPNSR